MFDSRQVDMFRSQLGYNLSNHRLKAAALP